MAAIPLQPNWQTPEPGVRPPRFADDVWYSSVVPQLQMDIRAYLAEAAPLASDSPPRALIVPHGGYLFSGPVLAAAYATLNPTDFDRVLILGPTHHADTSTKITTVDATTWRTPLGKIPVDTATLNHLPVKWLAADEDAEHTIEIHLPFLQITLNQFTLLPLYVNLSSLSECEELAAALLPHLTPQTLLIASTDLSRYYPAETAHQLDQTTCQHIRAMDPAALLHHAHQAPAEQPYLCGVGAVATVLHLSKLLGATHTEQRHYATTADAFPLRKDKVIGYAAFAITVA